MAQIVTQTIAKARSPAAERMARSRKRKRDGLVWLEIELRHAELDGLIRLGLLDAGQRHDKVRVTEAFYAWLDQTTLGSEP